MVSDLSYVSTTKTAEPSSTDDIRVIDEPQGPAGGSTSSTLLDVARFAPVFIATVYVAVFLFRLPQFIERLYWDSDAAVAAVVAETAGEGETILGHYGWYTTLWVTQLTRWLPFHHELWEYAPYAAFLGAMAALSWVSYRFAGGWSACMTAAGAIAISPALAYVVVSLNFHTNAWSGTAVMAALAAWLVTRSSLRTVIPVCVVMAVYAGATIASDQMFLFIGLAPFGVAGAAMLAFRSKRFTGVAMLALCAAALPIASLTKSIMASLDFRVWEAESKFATTAQIWPNFGRLVELVIRLANGNYFAGQPLGLRAGLSLLCAGLMVAGVVVPFLALKRELQSTRRNPALLAYCAFWAASVGINIASYVFSTNGTQPGYYVTTVYFGLIATLPLLMAHTRPRQLVASAVLSVLAFTSLLNFVDKETALYGGLPPVAAMKDRIVEIAQQEGVTKGYADYWDAYSLTWHTDMALRVQAVQQCRLPDLTLCPFGVNLNTSWYDAQPGKSFLLQDKGSLSMQQGPPTSLGAPESVHQLGSGFTMYIYPFDLTSHLDYSDQGWTPKL
jgi:hypothetical protein